MRILHTSDWHIGRTFHGVDLLADQAAALQSIADVVAERAIDVVLVAGDIYDRAIPSADAIVVCNKGFEAIRQAGATIVATSGNHDSPARLGAASAFAAAGGLHLITRIGQVDAPVVLDDEHGPVAFYGIPYLEPETTRVELDVPQARSHAEVLDAAMDRIRMDLARRDGHRSVVLAHAFVVGGDASGSERSIAVGGVETVGGAAFHGVDYVALGHLHSPQVLSDELRYSGSLLPYSFAERSHRKAVWIIELDAAGLGSVRRCDLPTIRGLSQLTGTLEELRTHAEFDTASDHYVSAVLTDPVRPKDALRLLQERFPHTVHVEWKRPQCAEVTSYASRVRGRADVDIARSFLADVRSAPTEVETHWLQAALAAATNDAEPLDARWAESA
ncbi:exonuclease SbcCD subunit D [Skermania sp. ID1734]|uniref:exonuclease SbcCD subunit D n=1 Tax=Skermania sp. ID1734 TaxID=2597516 RepID=UPI00117FE010|nr:exonuclease SbcCD subunit D [Skermania sp. ID1734]TSE01971.1 exonuclease SbcCD subunit D [Skermania sp. ID1734]